MKRDLANIDWDRMAELAKSSPEYAVKKYQENELGEQHFHKHILFYEFLGGCGGKNVTVYGIEYDC